MIIDLENGRNHIGILVLIPIMDLILEVKKKLFDISFIHIYKEFNVQANKLSKEALFLPEGSLGKKKLKRKDPFLNLSKPYTVSCFSMTIFLLMAFFF